VKKKGDGLLPLGAETYGRRLISGRSWFVFPIWQQFLLYLIHKWKGGRKRIGRTFFVGRCVVFWSREDTVRFFPLLWLDRRR
jgi:hypothetical protein